MARKRFSDEDVIRLLRQIEVKTASGANVAEVSSPFYMYHFDVRFPGLADAYSGIDEA